MLEVLIYDKLVHAFSIHMMHFLSLLALLYFLVVMQHCHRRFLYETLAVSELAFDVVQSLVNEFFSFVDLRAE